MSDIDDEFWVKTGNFAGFYTKFPKINKKLIAKNINWFWALIALSGN